MVGHVWTGVEYKKTIKTVDLKTGLKDRNQRAENIITNFCWSHMILYNNVHAACISMPSYGALEVNSHGFKFQMMSILPLKTPSATMHTHNKSTSTYNNHKQYSSTVLVGIQEIMLVALIPQNTVISNHLRHLKWQKLKAKKNGQGTC